MPLDVPGNGSPLVFCHANGFAPLAYRQMTSALATRFSVTAPVARPLFRRNEMPSGTWLDLADDYCAWLREHDVRGAVGVGHSLGAVVTLIAAARIPKAFSQLTLIEPVVLSPWALATNRWMPTGLRSNASMIQRALGRTTRWPSRQAAFDDLRARRAFLRLGDAALWYYVIAGTRVDASGAAELLYSREWEAHLYACIPNVWPYVKRVEVPLRVLRGSLSDVFERDEAERWKRLRPDHSLIEVDAAGHLLPLERPLVTASLVLGDDAQAREALALERIG